MDETSIALGGLVIALFLLAYCFWPKKREARRVMSKRDRRNYLRKEFADLIVDGIEDRVYRDKITRHEATKMYSWASARLELPDLVIPESVSETISKTADLKERIRLRMGLHRKVDIPGAPIPISKVNPKKERKTHLALVKQLDTEKADVPQIVKLT